MALVRRATSAFDIARSVPRHYHLFMPVVDSKVLRRLREALGWTQEDLATKVGCDCRTIQRAEKEKAVRLRTASEISKALGVELSTIISPGTSHDDRGVAAFKAADDAIQNSLAHEGEWGVNEATAVLSLLATRYGSAIARQTGELDVGLMVIKVAFDQAEAAVLKDAPR